MFNRVAREVRLSDKVASRILEVIVERPLRPGEVLPSERALGEQFGVSRTVIREALRSLAGKGVVEMSQGRGLRVARVEPASVRESMNLFLKGRPSLDYGRVHEVRALLETEVAGLAAERAGDDDLAALSSACDRLAEVLGDPDAATEADFDFHRALARATHNELFLVVLDAIDAPLREVRLETFATMTRRAEVALAAHRAIYDEVRHRDMGKARSAMQAHLDDVLLAWSKVQAQLEQGPRVEKSLDSEPLDRHAEPAPAALVAVATRVPTRQPGGTPVTASYFLSVKAATPSRLWVNNPTLQEIDLALAQGAVGCTTNPAFGGGLLKRCPEEVVPIIEECAATADPRVAAGLVQQRLVARIAERFRPLFDASEGREGYVSIQGAPDEDHDGEVILEEGEAARALAPNIAIKIPATLPGFHAFGKLVAEGTPTIITEVFSLAQLVHACESYGRVTSASGKKPAFFMSPITGILCDHLKAVAARDGIACAPSVIDWAGVALARACYRLVEERSYPVTLLFGGARLPIDFTGLVGGRSAATINYSTIEEILGLEVEVADTIHAETDPAILAELTASFRDFAAAMSLDGLRPDEFETFGPVLHFRNNFIAGWSAVRSACERARSGLPVPIAS